MGLVVSEKKIFSCFPMTDNEVRGVVNLNPRGMVGRSYKGNYYTQNIKALDFAFLGKKIFTRVIQEVMRTRV